MAAICSDKDQQNSSNMTAHNQIDTLAKGVTIPLESLCLNRPELF